MTSIPYTTTEEAHAEPNLISGTPSTLVPLPPASEFTFCRASGFADP